MNISLRAFARPLGAPKSISRMCSILGSVDVLTEILSSEYRLRSRPLRLRTLPI